MDKKFISENKSILREFVTGLLAAMLSTGGINKIKKAIAADPQLQNKQKEIQKLGNDIRKRIEKYRKSDPEKYNKLKKLARV